MTFGRQHPEWPEFQDRIEAKIAGLVNNLSDPVMEINQTNFVRGEIAALRDLINEQKPGPAAPPPAVYS